MNECSWLLHFPYKKIRNIHLLLYFVSGSCFQCMLLSQISGCYFSSSVFCKWYYLPFEKARIDFSLNLYYRYCWKGKKCSGEIWIQAYHGWLSLSYVMTSRKHWVIDACKVSLIFYFLKLSVMLGIWKLIYFTIEEFNVSIYYEWTSYNVYIGLLTSSFIGVYFMSRIIY